MSKFKILILCFYANGLAAQTIDISTNLYNALNWTFSTNNDVFTPTLNNNTYDATNQDVGGYWTANLAFDINSSKALININSFLADDRAQIFVNGHLLDSVGIYRSGESNVGGITICNAECINETNVAFNANGSSFFTLSNRLHVGFNQIQVVVNNTYNGIYNNDLYTDGLVPTVNNNHLCTNDSTYFSLNATISSLVPEPSYSILWLNAFILYSIQKIIKCNASKTKECHIIQSSRNTGVACSIKTHAFRRVKLSTKVL